MFDDWVRESGRSNVQRASSVGGGAETSDTDRLWLAIGAAMVVWVAWSKRDTAVAALVPYGLAASDHVPGNAMADYHITVAGWITLGVLVAGLVAAMRCVGAGMQWMRWRREGGVEAVPPVPAIAAGVVAASVLLVGLLALRWPAWVVCAMGVCGGSLAGLAISRWGQRYRVVAAFTGRAEQVLGYGRPGVAQLKARSWHRCADGGQFPGTLEATTGPGWQNKPSELAELGRYAREFGWPGERYAWRFDPMRRRVTGTINTGGQ